MPSPRRQKRSGKKAKKQSGRSPKQSSVKRKKNPSRKRPTFRGYRIAKEDEFEYSTGTSGSYEFKKGDAITDTLYEQLKNYDEFDGSDWREATSTENRKIEYFKMGLSKDKKNEGIYREAIPQ